MLAARSRSEATISVALASPSATRSGTTIGEKSGDSEAATASVPSGSSIAGNASR